MNCISQKLFQFPHRGTGRKLKTGSIPAQRCFSWIVLQGSKLFRVFQSTAFPPCPRERQMNERGNGNRTVNIIFYYEGHKRFQTNHKSFLLGGDACCILKSCFVPRSRDMALFFLSISNLPKLYLPMPVAGCQELCCSLFIHSLEHNANPGVCALTCLCAFAFTI